MRQRIMYEEGLEFMSKTQNSFECEIYKDGKRTYTVGTNESNLSIEVYQLDKGVRRRVFKIEGVVDGNTLNMSVHRVSDYGGAGSSESVIASCQTVKDHPSNISEWVDV